jgi:Fe-S cluster assembly protein SufD
VNALPLIDLKDASSFPSRRVEAWKYSDLRKLLREAPPPSPSAPIPLTGGGPFEALGGEAMVFVNGRPVDAAARMVSGEQTVRLRLISKAEGTGHTVNARISARAGARLLLLETHEGQGAGYVAHNRLELDWAEGAEVPRVVLTDEPEDDIAVTRATVRLARGARYRQTLLASGAKLQRLETEVSHPGQGADARLDGVYVLSGARHADLTSVVDHLGPNGTTSQLTKGVVRDTARGVFQGRIVASGGPELAHQLEAEGYDRYVGEAA